MIKTWAKLHMYFFYPLIGKQDEMYSNSISSVSQSTRPPSPLDSSFLIINESLMLSGNHPVSCSPRPNTHTYFRQKIFSAFPKALLAGVPHFRRATHSANIPTYPHEVRHTFSQYGGLEKNSRWRAGVSFSITDCRIIKMELPEQSSIKVVMILS